MLAKVVNSPNSLDSNCNKIKIMHVVDGWFLAAGNVRNIKLRNELLDFKLLYQSKPVQISDLIFHKKEKHRTFYR